MIESARRRESTDLARGIIVQFEEPKMSSKYCLDCGFIGKPKQKTPGTFLWEIVLWLFFLVPGVIYSIWRLMARYQGCAKCGGKRIVPVDSPVAQAAIRNLLPAESTQRFCTACGKPLSAGSQFCQICGVSVKG